MTEPRIKHVDRWICLALLLSTAVVYAPVRHFNFVTYDDPEYVTDNRYVRAGVTLEGFKWAFSTGERSNWFPLTRLSHMLDYEFFGGAGGAHHLTSLLLHALAALLLFAFLRRATGERWPAAFVAFLFALHPLHVESVAWVSERKDVLSAVFWFLTLWVWVRYAERPAAGRYLAALALFGMGLMAKPMLVSLPFVLLLLDGWPLRRGFSRKLLLEKIPFFGLSVIASAVTFLAQRAGGSVQPLARFSLGLRFENALISWIAYIAKMFWPVRLAVFYPYPRSLPVWGAVAAGLALAGVSAFALLSFRNRPWLTTGWCWYLGTLVPVIGLVQVGQQARADRYMYIPLVGLGIILAWGGAEIVRKWPRARQWVAALAVAASLLLAIETGFQLRYWRNSESLYRHALDVTTGNYQMCFNLGAALAAEPARQDDAANALRDCIRLKPDYVETHKILGLVLMRMPGRRLEAISEFRTALGIRSDDGETQMDLGVALAQAGLEEQALEHFEEAVRINPDDARAQLNLGIAQSRLPGRMPEAIAHLEEALRLRPDPELRRKLDALEASRR